MAADNPTQATNESIQATADQFFPIFSKGQIQDSLEAVKKCYQQTAVTDPNIEQCMIADSFMTLKILAFNNIAQNKGQRSKYSPYVSGEFLQRILEFSRKTPNALNYDFGQLYDYIEKSEIILEQKFCQRTNYKPTSCKNGNYINFFIQEGNEE